MALNLIRNSRVFYTNNVTNGIVNSTGFDNTNTFEVQVQDGFSFSQNTGTETVTLNEAGSTPIRGQRNFNTSLEPVDWSFATYLRPKFLEGATVDVAADVDDSVYAEEAVLWNALSGTGTIGSAGAGWSVVAGVAPVATVAFTNSNAHQLKSFGLIIRFEAVTYVIDNCAIDSVSIDFGLDAIASGQWAGKGTAMRQLATTVDINTSTGAFSGGLTGATSKQKDTSAAYIANKLSTMSLAQTAAFPGQSAKTYTLAITGGNLTINNNLTYLTPANLGTVNVPITYFTGTRAITATVTAYLKTGTNETSTLLTDLLAGSASSTENQYAAAITLNSGSAGHKVVLDMPFTKLSIPTITSEQVISTSITLSPQGGTTSAFNIETPNELSVKYYALTTAA